MRPEDNDIITPHPPLLTDSGRRDVGQGVPDAFEHVKGEHRYGGRKLLPAVDFGSHLFHTHNQQCRELSHPCIFTRGVPCGGQQRPDREQPRHEIAQRLGACIEDDPWMG